MPTRNLNTNLKVTGSLELEGILYDGNSSAGTNGQVLSSTSTGTDWVTLSEISGVDGTGTANYLSKWLDANTITNSLVYDNGTNVGIGTTNPTQKLDVAGTVKATSYFLGSSSEISLATTGAGNVFLRPNGQSTSGQMQLESSGNAIFAGNISIPQPKAFTFANSQTIRDNGGGGLAIRVPIYRLDLIAGTDAGNGHITFQTNNGTERMRVSNGGNVGIGTTSPNDLLEVYGSSPDIRITNTAETDSGIVFNDAQAGTSQMAAIKFNSSDEKLKFFVNDEVAQRMVIDTAGNVGIGTGTPAYKLDVNGDLRAVGAAHFNGNAYLSEYLYHAGDTNTAMRFTDDSIQFNAGGVTMLKMTEGSADVLTVNPDSNNISFQVNGVGAANALFVRGSDGNVGVGTNSPQTKLHVNGSIGAYTSDYATGSTGSRLLMKTFASTGNTYSLIQAQDVGGTSNNVLALQPYGDNVGIGTTSPAYKLDVAGDARIGSSSQTTTSLYLTATNTAGAPAMAVQTIMQGYEGRGLGTFYTDTAYSGKEWFCGLNYSGAFLRWSVGYDPSGGQGEYLANAKFTVFNNGNVGIGVDNPLSKLHIDDNASTGTGLLVTGGGIGAPLAKFTRDVGGSGSIEINSSGSAPQIQFASYANTFALGTNASTFEICDNNVVGTNTRLSITSAGNVGIATSSPNSLLHLEAATSPALQIKDTTNNVTFKAYAQDSNSHLANTSNHDLFIDTNNTSRIAVKADGNVGIGTTNPKSKLDVNGVFCVDSKVHTVTDTFTTCLTVNLDNHTGCHVVITLFGDWSSHSSAAYRGEFFLQNGANGYGEPGIILRQDDNTSVGTDQIICQIVDPTSTANPKDFQIQIRHTDTTSPASWTGQLTYTVQGKFNSIT
jgi:hypothetical protein